MTGVSPTAVLEVEGLRKRYGSLEAVRGVSFRIAAGETYGLLGPNGAGKTTTISMVCGLLARDAGSVTVAGRPVDTGAVEAKAAIGVVPQDLAIYPDLQSLVHEGGGVASVLPNIGVLALWGVGALLLAAWRFRRAITG